jgi:hypothetical protein
MVLPLDALQSFVAAGQCGIACGTKAAAPGLSSGRDVSAVGDHKMDKPQHRSFREDLDPGAAYEPTRPNLPMVAIAVAVVLLVVVIVNWPHVSAFAHF